MEKDVLIMTIIREMDFNNFEPWAGAISVYERIYSEGKMRALEAILDDLYPDGMTDTQLNDLLRFDSETVFEWLDIRSEETIKEELQEMEEELQQLYDDFECDVVGYDDSERNEIWESDYEDDVEEIKERIAELKEELANI
jgi:hypothetical protein